MTGPFSAASALPAVRARYRLRPGEADLPGLYPWFETLAAAAALPDSVAFKVHLVLEEAVSNAARHGFDPGQDGTIVLEVTITPDRVVACLTDDGRPFDPVAADPQALPARLDDLPVGGLGLRLIRNSGAILRYRRTERGNELTMIFPNLQG